jgi:hypothetical protein
MIQKIDPDTKLSAVLDLDPQVVDYIVSLNPHDFARLYTPMMRRFMAPRITLRRVAAMTNQPVEVLLQRIAEIACVEFDASTPDVPYPQKANQRPAWVDRARENTGPVVDLLPMDATLDADPMPPISRAIKHLAADEVLLIKHKWEPQPLYDIWRKVGIVWYAERISTDEWWIWVKHGD